MHQSENAIDAYVEALEQQRRNPQAPEELADAALGELQEVGAVVVPVEQGEWTLRADRDESGAFIAASFAGKP
jgi:hypothetical protein